MISRHPRALWSPSVDVFRMPSPPARRAAARAGTAQRRVRTQCPARHDDRRRGPRDSTVHALVDVCDRDLRRDVPETHALATRGSAVGTGKRHVDCVFRACGAVGESVERCARWGSPIAGAVERRDPANRPQEPAQNQSIDVLALADPSRASSRGATPRLGRRSRRRISRSMCSPWLSNRERRREARHRDPAAGTLAESFG